MDFQETKKISAHTSLLLTYQLEIMFVKCLLEETNHATSEMC